MLSKWALLLITLGLIIKILSCLDIFGIPLCRPDQPAWEAFICNLCTGIGTALATGLAARIRQPFTFCYLSGMGADPSESAWLPWEKLTRHLKGRTEKDRNHLQARYTYFCVHSFRPGGILPDKTAKCWHFLIGFIIVRVNVLANAMISITKSKSLFRRKEMITNSEIEKLAAGI
ncbi:hypothetical protein [Mucilaginibacter jinjuensis]|uniref:Transmembrane protein n=1 Tax=Mucilaginibacter jinjuensis TaxID=1176721 RepID=A0ABY7TB45_9SPHI|nr:hypothetical protein [Mucilaginibacter jinjuensis]WCT13300.1 hypothetical protein PQO05_05060 [Mucilaginibacter jinjuensis]